MFRDFGRIVDQAIVFKLLENTELQTADGGLPAVTFQHWHSIGRPLPGCLSIGVRPGGNRPVHHLLDGCNL